LKIIFGLDLDGYQDPGTRNRFNELICGPNGLLDVLELRLGLASKPASTAVRVAQYRSLLENAASAKSRFYSASFAKDAFSTAEELLRWRDELILAGWDGSADPAYSPRLRDLADVEKQIDDTLSPGFGDRVRSVLTELDRRAAKLDTVEVIENREHVPSLLRKLLVKLGAFFGCAGGGTSHLTGAPGTDLRKIQEALANPGRTTQTKLDYDGTVIFVTAYSEVTLAHHAAQILERNRHQGLSSAIIAENDCLHLEFAFRAVDEPVLALSPRSAARPVAQTLALALALRWGPLDPRALLAFLVHPVSPMDHRFRTKLAGIVANYPGVGGREWNSGIEAHRQFLNEKFSSDPVALRKALKRSETDLALWIVVERFDPSNGASGGELASTCKSIAAWAMATATSADLSQAIADQYARLASNASDLATILKPLSRVPRAQLEGILDQVVGNGVRSSHSIAEAEHAQRLNAPGAFLEPVDSVLWWDFRETSCALDVRWTQSEIQQLERSGVELLPAAAYYARENLAVLKAILATKKQLIFMTPRMFGNEPATHHPLRDRIQTLINGKLPVLDVDQHLAEPPASSTPALARPTFANFSTRKLPKVQRWWKLPAGQHLCPRDFESFSSAEKFIFSPYAWVLKYKARLESGLLFANRIVNEPCQRGNLLHRLSELVFASTSSLDWIKASRLQVHQSLETEWLKLLPAEGANLMLPGNRSQAESLFDQGERAIWSLIEYLREASVAKTGVNVCPARIPFVGGELLGYIDLLVENNKGRKAIVDLKYNGYATRKDELANNLQLQLAVYGYLIANGGAWPESAFFILKRRTLLTQNGNFFPTAETVRSSSSRSGIQVCWNEFEEVWKWRRSLLDQGWIELTVGGADPGDGTGPDSKPPIERWLAQDGADRFNDFDALTGWEEDA
jgi:PD-(D/E)XK nuclease superfamily